MVLWGFCLVSVLFGFLIVLTGISDLEFLLVLK